MDSRDRDNFRLALARHTVIFGERGSGKTSLALALACRYLGIFHKRRFIYISPRQDEITSARDAARRIEGAVDAFTSLAAAHSAACAASAAGGVRVDVPVVVDNYNVLIRQYDSEAGASSLSSSAKHILSSMMLSSPLVIVTSIWRPPQDLIASLLSRRRAPSSCCSRCSYGIMRIVSLAPDASSSAEQQQVYLDKEWHRFVAHVCTASHGTHYEAVFKSGPHRARASVVYG